MHQIGLRISAAPICRLCCAGPRYGTEIPRAVDEAAYALAADLKMTKQDLMRVMMREWLEKGRYLPVPMLEEDGDVDGSA